MTERSELANPEGLEHVQRWLEKNSEVFLIIAGVLDTRYALVDSFAEFENITRSLSGRTEVYVFGERQLPLRGIADEAMLQQALKMLDEPEDFLILSLEHDGFREQDWFHGDMLWELRAKFEDFHGKQVAFGKMPPWWDEQNLRERARRLLFMPLPLRELRVPLHNLESAEEAEIPDYAADEAGRRTKFGGKPDWIQNDCTPACPSCNDPMHFVCQIDSVDHVLSPESECERPTWMFGDVGMIYVFFCFECLETASVFQCY